MPGSKPNMVPTPPFPSPSAGGNSSSGSGGGGGGGPTNIPSASSEMNSAASGGYFSNLSPSPVDSKKDILSQNRLLSPLSSGYQGSSNAAPPSQNTDPLLQGGGLPSLPSIKSEEPAVTSSPRPPEMDPGSGLPSVHSLLSVESKKEMFPNKGTSSPLSGFQESTPSSGGQSTDPLLQGGGVMSLPEPKSVSAPPPKNQKIVPNPSLRKGKLADGDLLDYYEFIACRILAQFSVKKSWRLL